MADDRKTPSGDGQETQARLVMLPAPFMRTVYANAFHTQISADELLLTACVSLTERDAQGPVVEVQPQVRLGMTINNAVQLADALQTALARHRSQFPVPGKDTSCEK